MYLLVGRRIDVYQLPPTNSRNIKIYNITNKTKTETKPTPLCERKNNFKIINYDTYETELNLNMNNDKIKKITSQLETVTITDFSVVNDVVQEISEIYINSAKKISTAKIIQRKKLNTLTKHKKWYPKVINFCGINFCGINFCDLKAFRNRFLRN